MLAHAMSNYLDHYQSIKNTFPQLVIAVEDVSDLWLKVKDSFVERLPFKNACINNKARNPITLENLYVEFILNSDSRLRDQFLQDQSFFWFHEPYATLVLVTCEDLDEYKVNVKSQIKSVVEADENEYIIVFVNKANPSDNSSAKLAKKVYAKIEVEFNSKKRERCCKLDVHEPDALFWEDFESKLMECIRITLDKRIVLYEDEIRKLSEQRLMPTLNFCFFFILKESLAFMFDMAHLHEDSLQEYVDLEQCYQETVNMNGKQRYFGGKDKGDGQAALVRPESIQLREIVQCESFREFEFHQYLFACKAKSMLPFCMREVWVLTACLDLIKATISKFQDELVETDIQKEFYRLQGDLYSLSRIKFMRLACLLGYGPKIEKSPANSAALSILPWPKPAIWPLMINQATPRAKHLGIQRKDLPIEPSNLLSEANRKRPSLSMGNMLEMVDPRLKDGSNADSSYRQGLKVASMTRSFSIPANLRDSNRIPKKLAEVHVAAEHALQQTISSPRLWKSLSSMEEYEKKYLELTTKASENYHKSWRKRHGVTLDGELGFVHHKHGKLDLAARSYEKVCALYASEGWQDLLAEVLPNLAECQKKLNDEAGYLNSCIRLLSLDRSLFLTKERQAFQKEVVRLANGKMNDPLHVDVSSLITFSGNGNPVELCDGDPGTLSVVIWSGFPDDITLDSLNLTLIDTHCADEGVKAASSNDATLLKPGKNVVSLSVPPQKPGSYVLGVFTGLIGNLRFRSHGFSKGYSADIDDFLTHEKPVRHILKVLRPRALVDLTPAVSSALLLNEPQWIGIVVRPINYSLVGSVLSIDTGPGLKIEESHAFEIEKYEDQAPSMVEINRLTLQYGKISLPDWTSDVTSILWIPVRAISDRVSRVASQRWSIVEGLRTMALNLDFGVSHNQNFDSTLAIHFTDPFNVSTRAIDTCSGTFLYQITLHSQVKASLSIQDAWFDLQDGFLHTDRNRGRPTSSFFPLTISASSSVGMLFSIFLGMPKSNGEASLQPKSESILNIKYNIEGNRKSGAHTPLSLDGEVKKDLIFKIALSLQKPISDPCLAVGFLPLPYNDLRVGKLVNVSWRIERLKGPQHNNPPQSNEEVLYEVDANSACWMIAGRKRGHARIPTKKGTRIVVSVLCVPLVAGHVKPPLLGLPNVEETNIRCNPPTPHLVCVLPPVLCSSYCIPA
ncbi:hypothetical protein V2J09_012717 [Rumex salicifolius]